MTTHIIDSLADLNVLKTYQGNPWVLHLAEKNGGEATYSFTNMIVHFRVTPVGNDYEVEVETVASPPTNYLLKGESNDPRINYHVLLTGKLEVVGANDTVMYLQFQNGTKTNDLYLSVNSNGQHENWLV
ncbi:MAG: hypothetical protein KDC54_14830 [Lewinella sp.]|nr:hypothetical protein [Lewinella sp.]